MIENTLEKNLEKMREIEILDASKELHTIQISQNQYTSIVIIRLLIQN